MENPGPASTVQAAKKPSAGPRSPRKSAKPGLSILHFPIQPPFAVSLLVDGLWRVLATVISVMLPLIGIMGSIG